MLSFVTGNALANENHQMLSTATTVGSRKNLFLWWKWDEVQRNTNQHTRTKEEFSETEKRKWCGKRESYCLVGRETYKTMF